ncbi:MAG: sugar transferase, partial [bacterium]|nr:sugar transferase [bacterium]
SYYLRFGGNVPAEHLISFNSIYLIFSLSFWLLMLMFGVYFSHNLINIHVFRKLVISSFLHLAVSFTIILFNNMYSSHQVLLSRWVFIIYFFILTFSDLLLRTFAESISDLHTKHSDKKPGFLLIPGQDIKNTDLKRIKKLFIEYYNLKIFHELESEGIQPVGSRKENLINILEQFNIEKVLFLNPVSRENVSEIIEASGGLGSEFWINPEKISLLADGYKLLPVENYPFFKIITNPIYGINLFIKRAFDILVSFILIIISLPSYLIIPVLIKIDSPGNVFFRQIRLGKNGKPIKIIKFRSMKQNAEEETGPVWTEKDDSRITGIGRLLRRFSLDEIPQFFSVLIGKLSIVGPRPERPFFIEKHPAYKGIRLLVKPGLTGLAQINGRYDLSFEEKLNFDIYYINNYSLWLDLEIFFKTIFVIIFQRGAR